MRAILSASRSPQPQMGTIASNPSASQPFLFFIARLQPFSLTPPARSRSMPCVAVCFNLNAVARKDAKDAKERKEHSSWRDFAYFAPLRETASLGVRHAFSRNDHAAASPGAAGRHGGGRPDRGV